MYDMISGNKLLLGKLSMTMNFHDQTVIWILTIFHSRSEVHTLLLAEALIEVYLSAIDQGTTNAQ
jgi:hypothetical protein